MRRAIQTLSIVLLATAFASVAGHTQGTQTMQIDAIGLIEYSEKPTFKVGDWVSYHMLGGSTAGTKDDYTLTVLIAGEEEWWGEDCFWVETWTERKGQAVEAVASLMSYAIFDDSAAVQHLQMYSRKTINGTTSENGELREDVHKVAAGALKSRTLFRTPIKWDVDTLAADTVVTPLGTFRGPVVRIDQGTGVNRSTADSTVYSELREVRKIWRSMDVPITRVAREDIESTNSRRAWMIGRSSDAEPLRIREIARGSARVTGFGHGMEAKLLAKARQKSLAQMRAERAAAARPAAPRRR